MQIKINWSELPGNMSASGAAIQQLRAQGIEWHYDHFGRLVAVVDGETQLVEIVRI